MRTTFIYFLPTILVGGFLSAAKKQDWIIVDLKKANIKENITIELLTENLKKHKEPIPFQQSLDSVSPFCSAMEIKKIAVAEKLIKARENRQRHAINKISRKILEPIYDNGDREDKKQDKKFGVAFSCIPSIWVLYGCFLCCC